MQAVGLAGLEPLPEDDEYLWRLIVIGWLRLRHGRSHEHERHQC